MATYRLYVRLTVGPPRLLHFLGHRSGSPTNSGTTQRALTASCLTSLYVKTLTHGIQRPDARSLIGMSADRGM